MTTSPLSPSLKGLSTFFTPIDTALSALAIVTRSKHQSLDQHLDQYRRDFFEQYRAMVALDNPCPQPGVGAPIESEEFPEQEEDPRTHQDVHAAGQVANLAGSYIPFESLDCLEFHNNQSTMGTTVQDAGGLVQNNSMIGNSQDTPADLADIILQPL